jgi:hypothetical protein
MDETLSDRLRDINTLLCQLDTDAEKVRKSNPALAWKLSNAVSEMHEEWEADADRKAENQEK